MATNIAYRCPVCGGDLQWNAELGTWHCLYCDGDFSLEQIEKESKSNTIDEDKFEKHQELDEGEYAQSTDGTISSDLVKYTCSHCGAEIVTDRATAATICVYCDTPIVMGEQLVSDFAPDLLIPFKIDKSKVMDEFKKFSKKPLTPKDFDCDRIMEKMQGVYAPFWLYDASCAGAITAEGINTKTWRSGDYEYTEKTYYDVYRSGTANFQRIPVDASSKTDNAAMDSIEPFDYSELTPFNPGYLAGFLAERYDEDKEKCYPRAQERIENTTQDLLKKTCNYNRLVIHDYNRRVDVKDIKYAMMPTWLVHTTYKEKQYLFAMNGQTGKFIGNLPIDKVKLIIYSLIGGVGGWFIGFIAGLLDII